MTDSHLRDQLINLLTLPQAHMTFEDAVAHFPSAHINTRPPGVEYTFWHLLEHLRICQWDLLDYIRNPHYQEREWPRGYWPAPDATTDADGWAETIRAFQADRAALVALVSDPGTDLHQPVAPAAQSAESHTILREILLTADHNAYHIGEFAILRQVMGLW